MNCKHTLVAEGVARAHDEVLRAGDAAEGDGLQAAVAQVVGGNCRLAVAGDERGFAVGGDEEGAGRRR